MFSTIRARLTLRSIRARLTFWYLLTLGVALAGFAAFFWLVRARALYGEFDAALELRAHQVAAELRPALLDLDPAVGLAAHATAGRQPLVVRADRSAIVYRAPAFPLIDLAAERDLAAAARDPRRSLVVEVHRSQDVLRVVTIRVPRPGSDPFALQLAASPKVVEGDLRELAVGMALAIVLVLTIAAYGSMRTARYALAPVDDIVARVRAVQSTGVKERLPVSGGSAELDRLVATLNEMLDRIAASMQSARRFAADASHELQTPLAVMRGLVESGEDGHTQHLLSEIERSSTLVRDLRLFALAEAGQVVADSEPVDVGTLAEECAEIGRALAEPKQVRIDLAVDGRPVVSGSALHLRRVLLNIVTNAITYSPAGATVRIVVTSGNGEVQVAVQDRGCGIGPDDLAHIFEPFYRADPARARATGGTGLGLAIADQVARAHGGRILVSSVVDAGSVFTVVIPARTGG